MKDTQPAIDLGMVTTEQLLQELVARGWKRTPPPVPKPTAYTLTGANGTSVRFTEYTPHTALTGKE